MDILIDKYIMPLYTDLEDEVIADIARRVKKTGRYTETAELMAKSMHELGYSPEKIQSEVMKSIKADKALQMEIAENTNAYKQEIQDIIDATVRMARIEGNALIAEAGNMAWNNDLSMWEQQGVDLKKPNTMNQMILAFQKQTRNALKNLTQTTGFKNTVFGTTGVLNMYQREMDLALLKVATGTFSYDQAVNDCVHRLAQSGLRSIDYANERTYQLDTAVRMSVRTGLSQLSGKVMEENLKSTGQDLVITSQHMGSRPEHAGWQNKVFSFSGKSKKYPSLEEGTGYGRADGLKGVNCTHDFYPFWEGASVIPEDIKEPDPVTINGKEYDYFQATQKQRQIERNIRATKREIEAQKTIGGDTAELQSKLRKQTAEYYKFSNDVGIRAKDNRLRVKKGTSDLRKDVTKKNAGYNDISKKKVHQVQGTNRIFEGKNIQEKTQIAVDMVANYTDRKNSWNGVVVENVDMRANGRFFKDGHIEIKPNANNRTLLHEVLHSYSAPYISKDKYVKVKGIEEASVELLAREICNEQKIPYTYSDNESVNALIQINQIMNIETEGVAFAKLVYNISPDNRLSWLSGKIERYSRKHVEKQEELNILMDIVRYGHEVKRNG